jgi:hypothetical protein
MKIFIIRLLKALVLLSLISFILNWVFFELYLRIIPENTKSLNLYLDTSHVKPDSALKIAVIGGSNVQSNLDFAKIRSHTHAQVDFFSFPGSVNYKYVEYIIQEKILDTLHYDLIINYLPYNCYNNGFTFIHNGWGFHHIFINKKYLRYITKEKFKTIFFESWGINFFRQSAANENLQIHNSKYFYEISYSGKNPLEHNLKNPNYTYLNKSIDSNVLAINSNPSDIFKHTYSNNTYIYLPPIPDIIKNTKYKFEYDKRVNILNNYDLARYPKEFYFDMGGHLNLIGRNYETNKFIEDIEKLITRLGLYKF